MFLVYFSTIKLQFRKLTKCSYFLQGKKKTELGSLSQESYREKKNSSEYNLGDPLLLLWKVKAGDQNEIMQMYESKQKNMSF